MSITYSDKIEHAERLVTIVYGRSGVGKTKLVATCPKPLLVDFEGKLLALRNNHIPVYTVRSYQEFGAMFKFLQAAKEFETYYFDSLSQVAQFILLEKRKRYPNMQKAYGEMALEVIEFYQVAKTLAGNVIFTCKEKEEGIAIPRVVPNLPGRVANYEMPYNVSLLFRLAIAEAEEGEETRRVLQTRPTETVEAKDLSEMLDMFEEPDLTKIFNKIASGVQNGS